MSLQLVVIAGPDKDRVFALQVGPDLMLGRSQSARYRLNDPRVSRVHCQVLLDADEATVIDQGGSSGTLVNGTKVSRHTLKLGDVLQLGDSKLRLQVGDFAPSAVLGPAEQVAAAPALSTRGKAPDKLAALSGQVLSHYEVGPVVGKGHSSMVFRARDTKDGKTMALKVLRPEFSQNEDEMQRFVRAMKTVLPLRHPNLVALYGAGKTGPYCWVAMEFVEGESLTAVIKNIGIAGMLDWRHPFRVAVHIGRALAYAHGQQIIHRNVTPENILLRTSDKVAQLGDLILAKALEGTLAQQITRPGELVGDVAYMSPERTHGTAEVDGRSDLYGLGATAYALLTGRPPFEGSTLIEKITRIRQSEPVKPTKFQMAIPHRFEQAVLKLLAKRPEDRYQTANELVTELERIAKLEGVTV
jgi:serine/threonine protein kinase